VAETPKLRSGRAGQGRAGQAKRGRSKRGQQQTNNNSPRDSFRGSQRLSK